MVSPGASDVRIVGRYALCDEIAHGGMATVHVGRLVGTAGFARTVAIKRLHPQYAKDPDFVSMLVDEARLAARIHHPNVVATLDVVAEDGELFLVMEYIGGESLARLERLSAERRQPIPLGHVASIVAGVLHGLHAAHEARGEDGEPLNIVHRDVSPQNVLVGVDGVARVLDFGVAKAAVRIQTTRDGQLKGKLAYMAPEQLRGEVCQATDVYAAGVILWEGLAGRRLFAGENEGLVVTKIMKGGVEPPSAHRPEVSSELDSITLRALHRDPGQRFASARAMARALEDAVGTEPASKIGDWVSDLASRSLLERARRIEAIESSSTHLAAPLEAHRPDQASRPVARPRPEAEEITLPSEDVLFTQLTTGVTTAPAPAPRAASRSSLLAIAAVITLFAVVGGVAVLRRDVPSAAAPAVAPPLAEGTAAAAALPPSTVASASPPPEVAPQTRSTPAVAASDSPPPASAPLPRAVSAVRRPPHATNGMPPARERHCDPPYTVDALGVRTFKKECL
jgi:serine/threonine-protein kinase